MLRFKSELRAADPNSPFQQDPSSPGYYGPTNTALLLLDFHSLFVEKAGGVNAPQALAVASELRNWAKAQGMFVIHALIDLHGTSPQTCKGADRLKTTLTGMLESGGEESAELTKGMAKDERVFLRAPGLVSALSSPGLLDYLRVVGIKSLILTGLSTSGCVLRTAIPATEAGFVTTVITDAVADRKAEVHDMLISDVLPTRAHVMTAAEFQEGYTKAMASKYEALWKTPVFA